MEPFWLGAAAFALNLAIFIGGIVWRAGRQEVFWQKALNKLQSTLTDKMDAQAKTQSAEIDKLSDEVRREFGEGLSALRAKIHEVELFIRDTYVRRDSFSLVVTRIEEMIKLSMDKMDAKLDKLEERASTEASRREDNRRQ